MVDLYGYSVIYLLVLYPFPTIPTWKKRTIPSCSMLQAKTIHLSSISDMTYIGCCWKSCCLCQWHIDLVWRHENVSVGLCILNLAGLCGSYYELFRKSVFRVVNLNSFKAFDNNFGAVVWIVTSTVAASIDQFPLGAVIRICTNICGLRVSSTYPYGYPHRASEIMSSRS